MNIKDTLIKSLSEENRQLKNEISTYKQIVSTYKEKDQINSNYIKTLEDFCKELLEMIQTIKEEADKINLLETGKDGRDKSPF